MDALQILQQLSEPDRLPIEAIRAARNDRDSMVPVFLRCMEEFSLPNGTPIAPSALFFVFHLLGEWREKSAYRPMAEFLRMSDDALEPILGDAKTVTCHRVMAAVFDGDPNPLYEIIHDKDADEYIRSRMCQAIAMLTQQGGLPRRRPRSSSAIATRALIPKTIVSSGMAGSTRSPGLGSSISSLSCAKPSRAALSIRHGLHLRISSRICGTRSTILAPNRFTLMATSPCSAIPSRNWRTGIVSGRRLGPPASQSRRRHFTSPNAIFSVRSAAMIPVHAAAARNSKMLSGLISGQRACWRFLLSACGRPS